MLRIIEAEITIVKNMLRIIEAEIAILLRIFWASKSKKVKNIEAHFGQVDSYKKMCVIIMEWWL